MRILIITTEYPPAVGGIGSFAATITRGLKALGDSVEVIATGRREEREPDLSQAKSRLLEKRGFKLLPLTGRSAISCWRQRPDVTIAMTWTHEGIVALILRCTFGIPYVVVAHGSEILRHSQSRPAGALLRLIFRRALFVSANSSYTMRLVQGLKVARQVTVVNPPIDLDQWQTASPHGNEDVNAAFGLNGKTVLFTAGRLVPRKGHLIVIQALARLRERFPDLVFVFTGTGEYQDVLEQEAHKLGVSNALRMLGELSQTTLRSMFWRTDIYVSPTLQIGNDVEGFGIALVEAAVCGKAIIAGRSGGTEDAVVNGETGLLLDIVDVDGITASIALLIYQPELRAKLGTKARKRALQRFGINKQIAAFRLIVCQTLNQAELAQRADSQTT